MIFIVACLSWLIGSPLHKLLHLFWLATAGFFALSLIVVNCRPGPQVFSPQGAVTDEFCHLPRCEEGRSKDCIRWRHWPVAEVTLRAAEVIYVHLNRIEFTFSYGRRNCNYNAMQRVDFLLKVEKRAKRCTRSFSRFSPGRTPCKAAWVQVELGWGVAKPSLQPRHHCCSILQLHSLRQHRRS